MAYYKKLFSSDSLFYFLRESIIFHVRLFEKNGGDNLWALRKIVEKQANISTLQALPVSVYPILDVFIEDWFSKFSKKDSFGYHFILNEMSTLNEKYAFDNLFKITNEKLRLKETARSFAKEIALIEKFVETGKVDRVALNRGIKKALDKVNKNPKSDEYQIIKNFLSEIEAMINNEFNFYFLSCIGEIVNNGFSVFIPGDFPVLKFEEVLIFLNQRAKEGSLTCGLRVGKLGVSINRRF